MALLPPASIRRNGTRADPTIRLPPPADGRSLPRRSWCLAVAWMAYSAWSAGRALGNEPLTSPAIAQWIAVAAGPLALLGLVWLTFGRTRRKEAEKFTRSVVTMRTEARSLEALLAVLSQRINDSRSELTMISQHLMQLGDTATTKLGGITREFDSSTEKLMQQGQALDRTAEMARTDIAVLLDDLPRAEEHARAISEELRGAASETCLAHCRIRQAACRAHRANPGNGRDRLQRSGAAGLPSHAHRKRRSGRRRARR